MKLRASGMREGASAGSKMWKSGIGYFLKHFRRLQVSSLSEVASTNTRIKTSKINKSFATIRVLSLLDYTFVCLRILDSILIESLGLNFDLSNSFKSIVVSLSLSLSLSMLHFFFLNFRNFQN